jgi:hypothetical protein
MPPAYAINLFAPQNRNERGTHMDADEWSLVIGFALYPLLIWGWQPL